MIIRKLSAIIFGFILACAVLLPAARADEWNQMTKLEFSQPVEIPGGVLAPGAYWFVLQNSASDRHIVQIFSADWSTVYATLLAVPSYRRQASDDTVIEFAERPHDQPEALLKWYYPGRAIGHEFLYPSRSEKELNRDNTQDLRAKPLD
jgi:hypothetical protein